MRYFHGTSYEAGINIIQNGFNSGNKIWNCSAFDKIYFAIEHYDSYNYYVLDDDSVENLPVWRFVIEAGQIAAAHNNQSEEDLFVFEFDIPDNIEIEEDNSCENMNDCYQIGADKLNVLINDGTIKMTIYQVQKAYVPCLRIFYLKDLSDKYYFVQDMNLANITKKLKGIEADWFYDYLGQYESYTIVDNNLKIA